MKHFIFLFSVLMGVTVTGASRADSGDHDQALYDAIDSQLEFPCGSWTSEGGHMAENSYIKIAGPLICTKEKHSSRGKITSTNYQCSILKADSNEAEGKSCPHDLWENLKIAATLSDTGQYQKVVFTKNGSVEEKTTITIFNSGSNEEKFTVENAKTGLDLGNGTIKFSAAEQSCNRAYVCHEHLDFLKGMSIAHAKDFKLTSLFAEKNSYCHGRDVSSEGSAPNSKPLPTDSTGSGR